MRSLNGDDGGGGDGVRMKSAVPKMVRCSATSLCRISESRTRDVSLSLNWPSSGLVGHSSISMNTL